LGIFSGFTGVFMVAGTYPGAMATTPPPDEPGPDPQQRWTGRARVTSPAPARRPEVYGTARSAPAPVRPAPASPQPAYRGRTVRPRWGRIALVALAALALVAGLGLVTSYLWVRNVDEGLKRTDPFASIEGRPQKLAAGTLNILLLGTDSRDPNSSADGPGKWRTDTIVLMHIPASHEQAYLISLPRDLWVHVPPSPDGQNGNTMAKINAAFAWGGEPLMVQTVEQFTGVRIDHVALIDFGGFVQVTDAVGGVDMEVEQTITSIHPPYRTFTAGLNHFNGEEALDYIRQRYQFPDGDFTRIKHQQMYLKALLDKAVSLGTVTNIGNMKAFVTSVASAMTVDHDFSLIDLGWQFRGLRSSDLVFMTSPVAGTGDVDGQSVVLSDKEKASAMYDAVAKDTLGSWLAAANPAPTPGE
jgi:LCP family protein required for cell wall assembly